VIAKKKKRPIRASPFTYSGVQSEERERLVIGALSSLDVLTKKPLSILSAQ
jgi:hypothetical protein